MNNDNYSHSEPSVMYVIENIPGPMEDSLEYSILMENYNSQMLCCCTCRDMCIPIDCKCLQMSQRSNNDTFEQGGNNKFKLQPKHCIRNKAIIECGSNCSCVEWCGNRIVQNGPIEGLVVRLCENKDKGFGLFSSVYVSAGTFICEYAGELLTKSQALIRSKENDQQNKMNYVFCLNEHTNEGIIQTFVDPSKFGNIGRYINHSCDPNCTVVPVRYENSIPHLAIFAIKDIYPNSEITFLYGAVYENLVESNFKKKPCFCGAKICKGFMPLDNF